MPTAQDLRYAASALSRAADYSDAEAEQLGGDGVEHGAIGMLRKHASRLREVARWLRTEANERMEDPR